MRYLLKIGSITSLIGKQPRLSINGTCLSSGGDYMLLRPQLHAMFDIHGTQIPLRLVSVNHREVKEPSLLLTAQRDLVLFSLLYAVQGEEIPLYVEEDAPKELRDEASALLKVVADKERCNERDLLKRITAFKPGIQGREDIKFVSPRQLTVVIRILKEHLDTRLSET